MLARIPTIAPSVPRAAFSWVTKKLMGKIPIPLITSNRINTPEVAEHVLQSGCADMVSLARPFLADPDFVLKAERGKASQIAPCIACNQACLDHTFRGKISSCLVNPTACFETELIIKKAKIEKNIAVIGAGPAGLSAAITSAKCGHKVTVFEKSEEIGGQLNLAKRIPGKEEFWGLLDWFNSMLEDLGVKVVLGHQTPHSDFAEYDEVVIATGVIPKDPKIPGQENSIVSNYTEMLSGKVQPGNRVAVIGAGGIGFDVAEFLAHKKGQDLSQNIDKWMKEWGVGDPELVRGGLLEKGSRPSAAARDVILLQRKDTKHGRSLGKTTGWIHRASLNMKGVEMIGGVNYESIYADGIAISFGEKRENYHKLVVDNVVICAGQVSEKDTAEAIQKIGRKAHVIGGADVAAELDAKRAIDQGVRLALTF